MSSALLPSSRFLSTRISAAWGVPHYVGWNAPKWGTPNESLYVVTDADVNRPDLISYRVYGSVEYWWVILHYNRVVDPYSLTPGEKLRIPDIATVQSVLAQQRVDGKDDGADLEESKLVTVRNAAPPQIQPFTDVAATPTSQVTQATVSGFNFGFEIPTGLSTQAHFQIDISTTSDFENPLTRLTYASQQGWYYYDPFANQQRGAYVAFPAGGIDAIALAGQTVYYQVQASDSLIPGTTYFLRYRAWINQQAGPYTVAGQWFIPPPIIF